MANYFFTDVSSKKQGPIDIQQLKELLASGIIMPTTLLESDNGYKGRARDVPDLTMSKPNPMFSPKTHQTSSGFFDFRFTRFITNTWISFIWTVIVILMLLGYGGAVIFGLYVMSQGAAMGLVFILLATIVVPLYLLFARMGLELIIVFFRIETNTREAKECLCEIKEQLVKSK